MLKKLDKLIIKSFIGPFVATFFISMFLFMMLFLWKYIDDIIGKGLEWHVVTRLLIYIQADLIPSALPLAVLISGLMTFGNLSETSEVTAMKASGISVYRILLPVFIIIIFLAFFTFYVSNILIPKANLEAKSLLWDIRNKKPAFDLKEGVFYEGIEGYQIKIGKKHNDNENIENVLIYENIPGTSQQNIIKAKSGKMKLSDDKRILYFSLFNGIRYEELVKNNNYLKTLPATQTFFEKQEFAFDLSSLDLKKTDKELFKGNAGMMNIVELQKSVDSLNLEKDKKENTVTDYLNPYYADQKYISTENTLDSPVLTNKKIIDNYSKEKRYEVIQSAINTVRNLKSLAESGINQITEIDEEMMNYKVKWHEKFTLSFVIIILFLIAAPLGTIIRKGGLGMPLVISVLMYIAYHIINMIGIKMGKEGILSPWLGAWLASIILFPVSVFILRKAALEAKFFDIEKIKEFFVKFFLRKKKSQ